MRISMLGKSGSGKTTYMCALHEAMIENEFHGFSIVPHSSDLNDSLEAIGKLESISFCRDGENVCFPDGTTETTYWSFDLMYENKKLLALDWIDYRGGAINEIFEGEEEANFIKEIIYASNAVVIFVDSIQLALTNDLTLCKRVVGADKLSILLRDYERSFGNSDTIILFALSKCDSDLIPESYKENEYTSLISKCCLIFQDVIRIKNQRNRWHLGIVPISSVGKGRTYSERTNTNRLLNPYLVTCQLVQFPHPENVAESFLFCVKEAVNISLERLHCKNQDLQRKVDAAFNQATLFNSMLCAIRKKESYFEMAKKLNESKLIGEDSAERLKKVLGILQENGIIEMVYNI